MVTLEILFPITLTDFLQENEARQPVKSRDCKIITFILIKMASHLLQKYNLWWQKKVIS